MDSMQKCFNVHKLPPSSIRYIITDFKCFRSFLVFTYTTLNCSDILVYLEVRIEKILPARSALSFFGSNLRLIFIKDEKVSEGFAAPNAS